MKERQLVSSEELAVAYAELHLDGYIEYSEDGQQQRLTEPGLDAAFKLWYSLPPRDRLSLFVLVRLIIEAGLDSVKCEGDDD